MENSEITLKIKHLSDKVVEVKISREATVAELKQAIAKVTEIKPEEQKLIFKGKILKDTDVLSTYKVEDGSSMHVVQTKVVLNQGSTTNQQTSNSTSGTSNTSNVPTNLQSGGFGLLNSMGFSQNSNSNTGPSPLDNPMFTSMFQSLLSNPQMFQSMIQNSPILRQMAENNPEVQQALNDPALLQMMSDPQVIQAAMGMVGRMGQGGVGTMGGSDFPMPGGSTSTNTTSTTSTTNSTQSGTSTNQNSQPNPFGMLGGGGGGLPNMMQMMQNMQNMQNMQGLFGQPFPSTQSQNQSTQSQSTENQGTGTNQSGGGTQGTSTTNTNPNFNPFMGFPGFGSPFGGFGFPSGGGLNQQTQQQQDNRTPEEKYKDQLQQLETMGFINKEVNIQILKTTNGNVSAAVERLLNMLG